MTPPDPLVALWQTAPKPDTQHLAQDVRRLNSLHQRLNWTVLTILSGVSLMLVFEEATGGIATHGALSAIWILGLAIGAAWQRRARCSRVDALTLDTVSLLNVMIARAKKDLFIARCLYAGVPVGAAAGFVMMRLASNGAPSSSLIQTSAGVAALVAMMLAGAVLARSRSVQVHELSEKLKSIQAGL